MTPRAAIAAAAGIAVAAALAFPVLGDSIVTFRDVRLGGQQYDQFAGVAFLDDGSLVAAGSTFLGSDIYQKGWAARVRADGRAVWELVFQEHARSKLRAVAPAGGGDVLVAGLYQDSAEARSLGLIARLDGDGRVLWAQAHGGPGEDEIYAIAARPGGGIVAAGRTALDSDAPQRAWLLFLDDEGGRVAERTYEIGPATALALLPDGDIVLAGHSAGETPDGWVARLDGTGEIRWLQPFGGARHDGANALAIAPGGDIVVAGETFEGRGGGLDAWLLRFSAEGRLRWNRTFGRAGTDRFNAVSVGTGGGIVAAGDTQHPGTDNFDGWVTVLDGDGRLRAEDVFGGSRDDRVLALAETGDGYVALAGTAQPDDNGRLVAWGRIRLIAVP